MFAAAWCTRSVPELVSVKISSVFGGKKKKKKGFMALRVKRSLGLHCPPLRCATTHRASPPASAGVAFLPLWQKPCDLAAHEFALRVLARATPTRSRVTQRHAFLPLPTEATLALAGFAPFEPSRCLRTASSPSKEGELDPQLLTELPSGVTSFSLVHPMLD